MKPLLILGVIVWLAGCEKSAENAPSVPEQATTTTPSNSNPVSTSGNGTTTNNGNGNSSGTHGMVRPVTRRFVHS